MLTGELENQILAIFFVAKEPVTFSQLREIYSSATTQDLKEALQHLISDFNSSQKAMKILLIWRLSTKLLLQKFSTDGVTVCDTKSQT